MFTFCSVNASRIPGGRCLLAIEDATMMIVSIKQESSVTYYVKGVLLTAILCCQPHASDTGCKGKLRSLCSWLSVW